MKPFLPILTITGSDTTGGAGVQADIQTITGLGGNAASVITAITSQNSQGISDIFALPVQVVKAQLDAILADIHPRAVKVGMVSDTDTIRLIREEVVGCRHIVCAPGLLTSRGERLMDDASLRYYISQLFPIVSLLVLKCSEASLILNTEVSTSEQMIAAASQLLQMGPAAVFLRGGRGEDGMVTGMLLQASDMEHPHFFSSPNQEGWRLHGVGGTLSSAIAVRLAKGDDVPTALHHAHLYIRSQVVYSVSSNNRSIRQVELYNRLMEFLAQHHKEQREVSFYADKLSVTSRYLSDVTSRIVGKSPKQLIAEYVMKEAESLLSQTSLTVQEVAQELSFPTQAAFAKFFRQQKGCSPSDFRTQ